MGEYKIKDIEVLTGIKAHTIRMWEKRYKILEPNRTDTKIRTYSDQDLTYILNISILYNSGIKISHIANLKKEEVSQRVLDIKHSDSENQIEEKLILALIEMDEVQFIEIMDAYIVKNGITKLFSDIIIPFFDRIGIMWLVGSINPAQEHLISNLIRQKLISEIDKLPTPTKNQKIVLFLPEHEWHEVGLLHFNYVLRANNIYTYYLGQSLPFDSLCLALEKLSPDIVLSSWLTAIEESFILDYFKNLTKRFPKIRFLASGSQIQNFQKSLSKYIVPVHSSEDLVKHI